MLWPINGIFQLVLELCQGTGIFVGISRHRIRTLSFAGWTVPPNGMIKINTDAGMMGQGFVGIGCVARCPDGKIVAMAARQLKVRWEASLAEFAAVRMGVQMAYRLGFRDVIIESDALNVISALQHKTVYLNNGFHFVNDVRNLAPKFHCLLASHVNRGGNSVAHFVARLGPRNGSEILWTNSFPQGALNLAELDLMN